MIRKIVKLVCSGIGWGCTLSCLISMIGAHFMGNEWFVSSPKSFSLQVIAAMLVGIGWTVPSLVYDNEKLSRMQQMLIHFGVGFLVYFVIAFNMGWVPIGNMQWMIIGLVGMVGCTLLIWFGFYFYYKSEAKEINKKIEEKEEKNA